MELKKGFKRTDFGIIPDDWDVKIFSDVMDGFSSGQTPYRAIKRYYNGNIPWITSGELNYNIITETNENITKDAVKDTSLKIIPKGTFLFAITGLEAAGTRGSCAITGIEATSNQSCMALYPKAGKLTTEFLFHFYVMYGDKLAFEYCQGTKQQSYTGAIAKKLPIILPSNIEEQKAISSALSDVDNYIKSLVKLINKKRQIKYGAMQELLKPKHGWKKQKLGEIAKFFKGNGLPKSELVEGGKHKCIHYGELFTVYKELIKTIHSSTNQIKNVFFSKSNDVLMPTSDVTPSGLATASCIKVNDVVLGGDILIIRTNAELLDGVFLSYFISANKQTVLNLVRGSTVYHLYGSDMKNLMISFPSIVEQLEISKTLTVLDNELQALEYRYQKILNIKSGLMQNLLTGKIRLV
jgi:type I restriction enzyme S subunit